MSPSNLLVMSNFEVFSSYFPIASKEIFSIRCLLNAKIKIRDSNLI
jgi:hypothetical protein